MNLTFNKKVARSVKCQSEDLGKLVEVYKASIDRINNSVKKSNNVQLQEKVPEFLEEEWKGFKFGEQQEIGNFISDPASL